MDTHIQICTENQTGTGPILYDGKFNEMDFITKDVIMGELLNNILRTAHENDIINEDLNTYIDQGHKIVIKCWKEIERQ